MRRICRGDTFLIGIVLRTRVNGRSSIAIHLAGYGSCFAPFANVSSCYFSIRARVPGLSFETYFASDFSMNTEYARRTNNKWDCSAGFHARATANGFPRSDTMQCNAADQMRDLGHHIALENNHLTAAAYLYVAVVRDDDDDCDGERRRRLYSL